MKYKKENDELINLKISYQDLIITHYSLLIAKAERIESLSANISDYMDRASEVGKLDSIKKIDIFKKMQVDIDDSISNIDRICDIILKIEEIKISYDADS